MKTLQNLMLIIVLCGFTGSFIEAATKVPIAHSYLDVYLAEKYNYYLMHAVQCGDVKRVQFLLECGANPNFALHGFGLVAIDYNDGSKPRLFFKTDDNAGFTPLIAAAHWGHPAVLAELLLRGDIDINAVDGYGDSAFHHAAYNGDAEIVNMLIEGGADVDVINNNNQTASIVARKNGYNKIADIIATRSFFNQMYFKQRSCTE